MRQRMRPRLRLGALDAAPRKRPARSGPAGLPDLGLSGSLLAAGRRERRSPPGEGLVRRLEPRRIYVGPQESPRSRQVHDRGRDPTLRPVPSTVSEIFAAAGTSPAGVVRWGTPPAPPTPRAAPATGIYVVALTDQLDSRGAVLAAPPLSEAAVGQLLDVRPELALDGARPTKQQLLQRLAAFWFPDEVALYIGLAGPRKNRPLQGEVAKRVGEYYDTPLGANGPHAGGWPLKTLTCLHDLYVHYAYCKRVNKAEQDCIRHFAQHVSETTRATLRDPVRVMPFANLEFPKGNAKDHGIRGARAPKRTRGGNLRVAVATQAVAQGSRKRTSAAPRPAPPRIAIAVTPHHRSQKVTAKDIEAGQVRIPIGATKAVLPAAREDILVVLRGRKLTCRWDPRYGEKERSGVIRVGKAAAGGLLSAGDVLAVTLQANGSVVLD